MHFLDILVVFSLDIGQISFHLVEKTCAARQFALLTNSIVFYEILAWVPACTEIKILEFFFAFPFSIFFSFCSSDWPSTDLPCN